VLHYEHRSAESLGQKLADLPTLARPLVLTDGVFASSGEIAPLNEMARWNVTIVVDDAHGMGVIGGKGEGTRVFCGLGSDRAHQTGTLSKALGGFGGVIASDRDTIRLVKTRSCALVGSTPMPIPMAAAALKSLEILSRNPSLVKIVQDRALQVKDRLRQLGFAVSDGQAPICSLTLLDQAKNEALGCILEQAGIYPNFIDYPGCPPGGHFRFTLSSRHTDEDIERLLSAIGSACETLCR
jgi:glycine C-acetyltransferase/8-amino-7-oxononanoate synthase